MELIFRQQTIQLDSSSTAEKIIGKMNELLDKNYYFSHFIADGNEVYEEHEKYLERHEGEIERLEVIAKTVQEFVNDLLLTTEEYIERATAELPSLSEEFYDNPRPETWGRLDQLLGGLQWVDEMLMIIGKSEAVPSNWVGYLMVSTTMQQEIRNLAEAMKNEDTILIGDIIQYELIPNFNALANEVKQTIDNEGTRHDLN